MFINDSTSYSAIPSSYLTHHRLRQSAPQLAPSTDTIALKFSGRVELPANIKNTIEEACHPFYTFAVDEARKKSQETFIDWVATQIEGKEEAEAQKFRADLYKAAREYATDYCTKKGYDPKKNTEVFTQPSTQKAKLSHRRSTSREFAINSAEKLLQDKVLRNDAGMIKLALEGIERLMDQIEFERNHRQRSSNPFSLNNKPPSQRWTTVHNALTEAIQMTTQWENLDTERRKLVPNSIIQDLTRLLKEGLDEVKPVHRSKSSRSITNSINKTRESLSRAHSQDDLLPSEMASPAPSDNEIDDDELANLRWNKFETDDTPYFPGRRTVSKPGPRLDLTGLQPPSDFLFPRLGSGHLSPVLPEFRLTPSPGSSNMKKRKTDGTNSVDSTESKESTEELIADLIKKLGRLNPESDADEIERTKRLTAKLKSYRDKQ
ncbi:MAG: hypothetical protein K0Q50_1959 [Vampirovibrio sp.]|jgi:hypothetical protein|nr:hypothetical protein [Vampirovibrio sp.]